MKFNENKKLLTPKVLKKIRKIIKQMTIYIFVTNIFSFVALLLSGKIDSIEKFMIFLVAFAIMVIFCSGFILVIYVALASRRDRDKYFN